MSLMNKNIPYSKDWLFTSGLLQQGMQCALEEVFYNNEVFTNRYNCSYGELVFDNAYENLKNESMDPGMRVRVNFDDSSFILIYPLALYYIIENDPKILIDKYRKINVTSESKYFDFDTTEYFADDFLKNLINTFLLVVSENELTFDWIVSQFNIGRKESLDPLYKSLKENDRYPTVKEYYDYLNSFERKDK